MSARSQSLAFAVVLATGTAACASHPAPRGWLPDARESQRQAGGGWVDLVVGKGRVATRVEGELIAVSTDHVHVLTMSGLVDVPQASVTRARLDAYRTAQDALAGWFVLGLLSTASHGGYLLLTVPMWLIGGGVALSAESQAALLSYPKKPFAAFRPYARFPHGLPADLERTELGELRGLRSKPARK